MTGRPTVIFDLGGVLLQHDPALAFARVLPPDQIDAFMIEIGYHDWHHAHDAGRTFADGLTALATTHPQHVTTARALGEHFQDTLPGYVAGTGAVLAELQQAGVRLLGLTNFPDEPFDATYERFGLLRRLEGILVSGREQLAKPDPAIFDLLLARWAVDPEGAIFVDDRADNCASAASVGMTGVVFTDADQLRRSLVDAGLLGPRRRVPGRILHLAETAAWEAAQQSGDYPWSTRGVTYLEQGYVHCSLPHQLEPVRAFGYADLDPEEIVLLEIDTGRLSSPVIMEDLGAGQEFPHVYGPIDLDAVVGTGPVPRPAV